MRNEAPSHGFRVRIPQSELCIPHYFRCRIRDRIRRFFRPTLRRPVPRRRAPMSASRFALFRIELTTEK